MDWTTMGAPPPIATPPTEIRRVFRLGKKVLSISLVILYPTVLKMISIRHKKKILSARRVAPNWGAPTPGTEENLGTHT
jgi:hypothetical protein